MKSLRCLLFGHIYENKKCITCSSGWRKCGVCGEYKDAQDKINHEYHKRVKHE